MSSSILGTIRRHLGKASFVLLMAHRRLALTSEYGQKSSHAQALAALSVPVSAGGAAAAQPAADRRLQLLPGRAQPDRWLLPVERLLPAFLRRSVAVYAVLPVTNVRHR